MASSEDLQAVLVEIVRSPVGKAPRGTLRNLRPDDIAGQVVKGLLNRVADLPPDQIDDVILGCAFPEGEQGMNIARIASQLAGLPDQVSAMTINRFCSSGLQSIALASSTIETGMNSVVIAGGVESMSMVPMEGHFFSPNPKIVEEDPDVYISMGLTAENVVERYGISRERQDEFALRSHHNALAARSRFASEIVALDVPVESFEKGHKKSTIQRFDTDEGPRSDTSMEALRQLKPVFKVKGTVTAGNSSQRSDGAAAGVLMSRSRARELGLTPRARLLAYATAGTAPEIMGIGPVEAIPKALKQADLELKDIELIELNEAFAGQALAVIQEAGLNPEIVNVNGGAIALGHPLGCTGAKL
ncbi:MAG TPA: thiolase family protein, partial [Acidobacteriota bacterium]|nr:thiolase family protein [Acidobacteriota bacterium]